MHKFLRNNNLSRHHELPFTEYIHKLLITHSNLMFVKLNSIQLFPKYESTCKEASQQRQEDDHKIYISKFLHGKHANGQ